MNTKELAEKLIKWLPELAAGKTFIAHDRLGTPWGIESIDGLIRAIKKDCEIRIKQTPIPDPPEGEKWHNPNNLTAEQIGIDAGWRLLLKSEIDASRFKRVCQLWTAGRLWLSRVCGICETATYRTKADEFPVGSLKPKSETELLAEKLDDIADYLTERGYGHITMKLVAAELGSGKVPWVELK